MNTQANPERATGCLAVLVVAIVALIFVMFAGLAQFVIFPRVPESQVAGAHPRETGSARRQVLAGAN
jgi:hypothetical protein